MLVVFPLIRPVPSARPTFSLGEKEKGVEIEAHFALGQKRVFSVV